MVEQYCGRCGGTGLVLSSVDGHRCWGCGATGTVTVLVSAARAPVRRQVAAARAEHAAPVGERYAVAKAALAARIPNFDRAHSGELGMIAAAAGQAVIDYRDRGNLEQALDDYDYATRRRYLPRVLGPNRYPGPCSVCRQRVPAGAGICGETASHWVTWCTAHVPTETRER